MSDNGFQLADSDTIESVFLVRNGFEVGGAENIPSTVMIDLPPEEITTLRFTTPSHRSFVVWLDAEGKKRMIEALTGGVEISKPRLLRPGA